MSAARKGKGPSTRDKVVSSALAVGAMAGIAGLLAFQTAQVASANSPSSNSVSGANISQASYNQQASVAKKSGKSLTGSRTAVKPSVTAPQNTNNAPQATTKGS